MAVLNSSQRNTLEKAVLAARRASEQGAVNALKAFAVHNHEPYAHMSGEHRALRNHLRSKARLLGDHTTKDGGHTINKLAYELAYEYWHRMLFARFLEANDLLIHPEHQMAVSLEECEELAPEEGHEDKWVAAAYYASKMLPAIFRQDDPLMEIKFATEDRIKLEQILESIEEEIYQADDSLGWVYQYWQSEVKETINASGDKIDGEKLPAVTQLFTEPYMVHFLIDNTLGAWWTARNHGITPPIEFKYLRTLDDGTPAAGKFEGWPDLWKDLTMMDPCMGSGHFVVEVFKVMTTLRKHDERLSNEEACDAVIKENIHGLELDDRCTQIAAFNLALTAWKFCGKYRELPEMNLACCGIAPKGRKEDWVKLANSESDPTVRARLKGGLERMYELFQKAPELGSLIDPTSIQKDTFTSDFTELEPFLDKVYENEIIDNEDHDRGIVAAGIAKSGKILSKKFCLIITNVPFLGNNKMDRTLFEFCEKFYKEGKKDLCTVFIQNIQYKLRPSGVGAVVSPQNWYSLKSFAKFRLYLLKETTFRFLIDLGINSFKTPMYQFNIAMSIFESGLGFSDIVSCLDLSNTDKINEKKKRLLTGEINPIPQESYLKVPDSRITFKINKTGFDSLLGKYATVNIGIQTGDNDNYIRYWWELSTINAQFEYFQRTAKRNSFYSGLEQILLWENGNGRITKQSGFRDRLSQTIIDRMNKIGIGFVVHRMGTLPCSIAVSKLYDQNGAIIIPKENSFITPIWAFLESQDFVSEIRNLDKKVGVNPKTFELAPFDYEKWEEVASKKYPHGLPQPNSDDPTQWLFHGHPKHTHYQLQVIIARLSGYQWPSETDTKMELSVEAKEKIQEINDLKLLIDEDGIICVPPVNGELAAADRIREQIMKIWGEDYDGNTIKSLLQQEGSKKRDLESYLRDDFFTDHCKLFKNRPFIWHIWDGRKDGFSALVNYHKLDKANLEKLIYTYLGDWIRQCELKLQNGVSGADGLLSAAKQLKEKLLLILKGEPPYDLFIRWKPLEEQSIGWDPDINDGVRLNVYPFVEAGVLRKKFNVKWKKDRGKNPEGSPWGPDRYNRYEDLDEEWKLKDEHKKVIRHLTTEIKRKAREEKR